MLEKRRITQVFIVIQPQQQGFYGKASGFNNPNTTNLAAFQSFLYVTFKSPSGAVVTDLNLKLVRQAKALYNPLDGFSVMASYDIVDLLAVTVNETAATRVRGSGWSGRHLAERMSNRNFSLTVGEMYVNEEGVRTLNLDVFAFNTTTNSMQVVNLWNPSDNGPSVNWATNTGRPPLDVPKCGFSGEDGDCAQQRRASLRTLILSVILGGGTPAIIVLLLLWAFGQYGAGLENVQLLNSEELSTQHHIMKDSSSSTSQ
ncbi:hypothetical protein BV898_11531 [Hypsibius exemplaris]|uniref:Receptor ligand binding region domain-containing protein n=1 Tax=Hypsibius exemplaris TaxID=2072580 RepID=A0A1W0WGG3_HYPEX|nr:hypothetical protein BV898_11531 [Hypsibius exemplaris]